MRSSSRFTAWLAALLLGFVALVPASAPRAGEDAPAAQTDEEKKAAEAAKKQRDADEKKVRRDKHDAAEAAFRERIAFYTPPPDDYALPAIRSRAVPTFSTIPYIGRAIRVWDRPRNLILLIGDGMGPGPVSYSAYRAMGKAGRMYMEYMPFTGVARTYSANADITDSAAAGTALATGHKTVNGRLARLPDKTDVPTILEIAKAAGWKTGIVSTKEITDATPAAFVAHVDNRNERHAIARQTADLKPEIILGGGRKHYLPEKPAEGAEEREYGDRPDGFDLVAELVADGYAYATDADGLAAALAARPEKLLGLFHRGNLANKAPEPMLDAMTEAALAVLAPPAPTEGEGADAAPAGPGFFLMVEGAQIDSAGHANNADELAFQTLHFDRAVAAALRFAAERGDTLVVVTADHDTGGIGLTWGEFGLVPKWTSGNHTPIPVPVYAYGPGASRFVGAMDNTEIPRRLAEAAGLKFE